MRAPLPDRMPDRLAYRPDIDGLRAVAVIPVILYHAGIATFRGGFVGVDVFFVISGYLITRLILNDLEHGTFSLANFYERRARRILPALFLVLLSCLVCGWWWMTPPDLKKLALSVTGAATFSANIVFWQDTGYFQTDVALKPLLHTWSLSIEEQYYLLFPWCLLLMWRWGKRRMISIFAAALIVSLAAAQWVSAIHPSVAFYWLPTRAWELLAGVLLAFLPARTPGRVFDRVGGAIGLLLVAGPVLWFTNRTPTPSLWTAIPVLGTALVIVFSTNRTATHTLLSHPILVRLGTISYSAYLWHYPIFAFVRYRSLEPPGPAIMLALSVITLIVAYGSWRLVEQPFRRWPAPSRSWIFGMAAAGSLTLAAVGLAGYALDGMESRGTAAWRQVQAELSQAESAREQAIEAGVCHFNRRGPATTISDFIANWHCKAGDADVPGHAVLVFGDSHAADITVALRTLGMDVTRISGADCPLAPGLVPASTPHCQALLSLAARQPRPRAVVLGNRLDESEITVENLQQVIDYWAGLDVPVYLFSPMPDFSAQFKEYRLYGTTTLPPSRVVETKFFETLNKISLPARFRVVKTSEIWCPADASPALCRVHDGADWLMTDRDHLSPTGARRFGARFRLTAMADLIPR